MAEKLRVDVELWRLGICLLDPHFTSLCLRPYLGLLVRFFRLFAPLKTRTVSSAHSPVPALSRTQPLHTIHAP